MKVKEKWGDNDFDVMNWHDNVIYSIKFPDKDQALVLDIDYIFDWKLNDKTQLYSFYVSPCTIIFSNVLYLNIDLDFKNSIGIEIVECQRNKISLMNKDIDYWNFKIITDKGLISFNTTGFLQIVREQPVFSESYSIGRTILG